MQRFMLVLVLPAACLLPTGALAGTRVALSDAVLHGALALASLRAEIEPASDRECLERYLAGVPARSPLWQFPPPDSPETAQAVLKRHLVEQMVALLGESVREESSGFAHEFPLLVEWEGMAESPLGEADFIVDWLAAQAGSPIASFLQLLLAHRLDAAWRLAPDDCKAALASRFDTALAPPLASENLTINCLARDLRARHESVR